MRELDALRPELLAQLGVAAEGHVLVWWCVCVLFVVNQCADHFNFRWRSLPINKAAAVS